MQTKEEVHMLSVFKDAEEINSHLVRRGFMMDYLIWVKHG